MHKSDSIFVDFNIKEKIRKTELSGTEIGGASSFPFMKENDNPAKPLVALEIPYNIDEGYPDIIKEKWQGKSLPQILEEADNSNADIISIKFNISENSLNEKTSEIKDFLKNTASKIKKPLILRGANNNSIDVKLIPVLAQNAPKESIIAFADEETYEQIVPYVTKYNHILVLRTPIDINLAKELNILSIDKGMRPERILIDPDMGGLGYGLDYGYSIIEKIKQAAFDGDTMLNMPIIAFIGEESYRAKEAKTDSFEKNWGDYQERSSMWEISGASAMISAGADIVVLWNPESIKVLKGII